MTNKEILPQKTTNKKKFHTAIFNGFVLKLKPGDLLCCPAAKRHPFANGSKPYYVIFLTADKVALKEINPHFAIWDEHIVVFDLAKMEVTITSVYWYIDECKNVRHFKEKGGKCY